MRRAIGLLATAGSATTALVLTCSPAHAQPGTATTDESDTIVVTARIREERLIDTPLSVQVLSAETLERERIDNVENLVGRTPNLSLSSNVLSPGNDFLNIVIRGIGAQSAGTPAVGTFVDGAFVPSLSFDIGFLDVQRVEVLRGPQSTLFGRNTQGGALNIVLRRPNAQTRGRIAFTYDEFDTARAQGAVSGQLAEGLFGSVAADVSTTDGYLRNPVLANMAGAQGQGEPVSANSMRTIAGRAALRYAPGTALELNLAIDGSNRRGLDGYPGVPRGLRDYIVRSEFQIDGETRNFGGALTIDYDLGGAAITAITAIRDVSTYLPFDFDGSPERSPNFQDIRSAQTIYSQELRVSGQLGSNINWLVGGYLFREDSLTDRSVQFLDVDAFPSGLTVDAQRQTLRRDGFAAFADVQWRPVSWLELSGGLRFSRETVDSDVVLDFALPGIVVIQESGTDSLTNSNVSPTVSLRANLSSEVSAYARYARGFRAGGFPLAPASATTNISFDPETSDNFEIGLKGDLANGAVRFDLALFQIDISEQQLSTIVFLNGDPTLPVASVGNAGKSRSRGFEAELSIRASRVFSFGANVGYTNARYREYLDTVGADRAGERFPYVPRWTGQLFGRATVAAGHSGSLTFGVNYRHVGSILSGSGVDVDVQFPVRSYDVLDISASYSLGPARLDLFVDNVTNRFIETRVFNAFFFTDPRPFSIVAPPRRAGLRFTYDFR